MSACPQNVVLIAALSYRCNFVKSVIIYIIAREAILIRAITSYVLNEDYFDLNLRYAASWSGTFRGRLLESQ